MNKLTEQVNDFMAEFAQGQDRIHFIRNYSVFDSRRSQLNKLYDQSDKNGVQFTNQGKIKLLESIMKGVEAVRAKTTPQIQRTKRIRSENTPPTTEKGIKLQKK